MSAEILNSGYPFEGYRLIDDYKLPVRRHFILKNIDDEKSEVVFKSYISYASFKRFANHYKKSDKFKNSGIRFKLVMNHYLDFDLKDDAAEKIDKNNLFVESEETIRYVILNKTKQPISMQRSLRLHEKEYGVYSNIEEYKSDMSLNWR